MNLPFLVVQMRKHELLENQMKLGPEKAYIWYLSLFLSFSKQQCWSYIYKDGTGGWYLCQFDNISKILEITRNKSSLNTKSYEKGITMNTWDWEGGWTKSKLFESWF